MEYLRHDGEEWFVVLPDCEGALPVAEKIRAYACRELFHASGRPWLIGRWADEGITQAAAGPAQAVVIGTFPVTTGPGQFITTTRVQDGLDRLARDVPGSFHLVANVDGQVRVQGSISGIRRVFHTTVNGTSIAADRADVLAVLTDAVLDEALLATRLIYPCPPHPVDSTLWHGIDALPCDSYLLIDQRGANRTVRWWTPPEPTMPLAEGADALREALIAAVDTRTQGLATVSSDMSGGLDSTSLCFLAARSDARLLTTTIDWDEAGNEDVMWADLAARYLPGIDRRVIPSAELLPFFKDVAEVDDPMDEPYLAVQDRARFLHNVGQLVEHGAQAHLSGLGGDEVLHASMSYLHSLARRHPRAALARVRVLRAHLRWSWKDIISSLLDRRTFQAWLISTSREVGRCLGESAMGLSDWSVPPVIAPWMTADAVSTARETMIREAAGAQPLAPTRGVHASLEEIRIAARSVRSSARLAGRMGLPMHCPFLDDRVIETCLAVRMEERATPWTYKPLLKEAMHGIAPDSFLARKTKDHCSTEVLRDLRRSRKELIALCETSLLAGRGLVDAEALRAFCLSPAPGLADLPALSGTLALERWLREVSAVTSKPSELLP